MTAKDIDLIEIPLNELANVGGGNYDQACAAGMGIGQMGGIFTGLAVAPMGGVVAGWLGGGALGCGVGMGLHALRTGLSSKSSTNNAEQAPRRPEQAPSR